MMSEVWAPVPGSTPADQRIHLAGALAELAVQRLVWLEPGREPRELAARETDLPGLLLNAPAGTTLRSTAPPLAVRLTPEGLQWTRPETGP
jgi:hypothetical protein